MKFQSFITTARQLTLTFNFRLALACGVWLFFLALQISAQRIAIIAPNETAQSSAIKDALTSSLSRHCKIIDGDLAQSVFQAVSFENPFNLSTQESQNLGSAIGSDYFLLLKTENLRRASFEKAEYYESYTVIYVVSSRTGRLIFWKLQAADAETADAADGKLFALIGDAAREISTEIALAAKNEVVEIAPDIAELPDESSPEAKDFRSPLPYRRMRPVYTSTAGAYGIKATVDALVDLDESGKITRVVITRWAGYGLDESVTKTINEMQWRAASRGGKALPIRVLLRYNFKKVEKED